MVSQFLNASDAARRLGISTKALRLYEQRGLLAPIRSDAGWRAYGPEDLERASEIVALRALGFSLAQVARILKGDASGLEPALAAHQASLEGRVRELVEAIDGVRALRGDLARGSAPSASELARTLILTPGLHVAFDLPWPWGGEPFELRDIPPLTYITGPLGSGKTRLAIRIAEQIDGVFLDLDRAADPSLQPKIEATVGLLVQDGATDTAALRALLSGLEASTPVVVDLIEQGLDRPTQEALIAHLRRRSPGMPPLFVMTRSSSILDLDALGPDEAVLFCPANHAPPFRVAPFPGTPGYEALASCLAPPEVRARSEGVIAVRR
ncbi:MAG: MerR family transcriptional regulator [Rhodospirillales bacterium 24-66-33]|nr:MAG: MerR family transcriptional regulator [Rhodospirillales bacterium 35-66-84]OYZ96259.1 MAG: MerR family transcriptional regulator [Rhodospirillales bacterium 24-66-33]OZB28579.1 MAG: MerR family transcriptional regulator [Rhodospirillales bacterium 39-66-50]